MAPKTTKREPTLKIGKINPAAIRTIEWEKRFTELEQELHRRTDAKTQSGIVYPDNVTTGQDWAKQDRVTPKGVIQELSEDINDEVNKIKRFVIDIRDQLIEKLGSLPEKPGTNIQDERADASPIEANLRATKYHLSDIHYMLTQINDLQEVKL